VTTSEVARYDVPAGRLSLAGVSLTRGLEQGNGVWRLELPRPKGAEPHVLETTGGPLPPDGDLADVLAAFLRGTELQRVDADASSDGDEPADAIGRLRAILRRQYAEILAHDPGVRLDLDAEDVHRMRVAARRARAVLRAARPMLDAEWSEPLRDELKWLGGSLGRRRDGDVLLGHLRQEIDGLEQPERAAAESLVDRLAEERDAGQAVALEALRSDRYYRLLDALESAARGPRVQRGEVSLRRLAKREFKRLKKATAKLGPDASDDELHKTRIACKRARYTAELAESEVGEPARRFVERAKTLQDVLGAHQDAIVAEAQLRGLLPEAPSSGAAFAAGRLVERQRNRRRDARAEVPKAWRKLKRAAEPAFG